MVPGWFCCELGGGTGCRRAGLAAEGLEFALFQGSYFLQRQRDERRGTPLTPEGQTLQPFPVTGGGTCFSLKRN